MPSVFTGCIITKFQFSLLFAQAWSKGITINNIVCGFRSAGIYSFASNVILDKFPKPKEISISEDTISSAEETSDKADGIEIYLPRRRMIMM